MKRDALVFLAGLALGLAIAAGLFWVFGEVVLAGLLTAAAAAGTASGGGGLRNRTFDSTIEQLEAEADENLPNSGDPDSSDVADEISDWANL